MRPEPEAVSISNTFELRICNSEYFMLPEMFTPHSSHVSLYIENIKTIFVLGGFGVNKKRVTYCESFQINQQGARWSKMREFANEERRSGASGCAFQNTIYVAGGYGGSGEEPDHYLDTIQKFNLGSQSEGWDVIKVPLHQPLVAFAMFPLDLEKFFIFGGRQKDNKWSNEAYILNISDLETQNYEMLSNIPLEGEYDLPLISYEKKVYTVEWKSNKVVLYDFAVNEWKVHEFNNYRIKK